MIHWEVLNVDSFKITAAFGQISVTGRKIWSLFYWKIEGFQKVTTLDYSDWPARESFHFPSYYLFGLHKWKRSSSVKLYLMQENKRIWKIIELGRINDLKKCLILYTSHIEKHFPKQPLSKLFFFYILCCLFCCRFINILSMLLMAQLKKYHSVWYAGCTIKQYLFQSKKRKPDFPTDWRLELKSNMMLSKWWVR